MMDTTNGRRRLESSALSWMSRADAIQASEDSSEARRAVARAEWEDEEPVAKKPSGSDASDAP